MKKLLKLKRWLTVPDAARHLSILFGEVVSPADVLRLALDGHLTLSVDFVNHALGNPGRVVPLPDAKTLAMEFDDKIVKLLLGHYRDQGDVLQFSRQVESIDDVWDLTMLGAERLDVEHRYQQLTDGPSIEVGDFEGPIVSRPGGVYFRIVSSFNETMCFSEMDVSEPLDNPNNFYPAASLPSDSVFVVRTSALQELEAKLAEPEPHSERPVGRRERTTLLVIIAALAKLARIEVDKTSSASTAIESQTALMGARVAARTIENHLKRIPEALETKTEE